uniref:Uncharacterized protein n=1 Tax=Rhizophora mucronata TaxID=61149 RepID=A0A2P2N848_RHIMU
MFGNSLYRFERNERFLF